MVSAGEWAEAAELYLQRLLLGQAVVFVPSSLFYEFGGVLWVRCSDDLTVEFSHLGTIQTSMI